MSTVGIGVLVLVAFLAVVSLGMWAKGQGSAAAKEKIKQGARVIDVRTPGEFASGHYPGATNIPLQELEGRIAEVGDKRSPVVVYCASGMRSAKAAQVLSAAGFADVTNAGGLRSLQ